MTDRISADNLPQPSAHLGSAEQYLHRACLLLDQVSRQLDGLLTQGQAPVLALTSGSDAQVELVSEPADPAPPARKAAAGAARASKKNPPASKKDG